LVSGLAKIKRILSNKIHHEKGKNKNDFVPKIVSQYLYTSTIYELVKKSPLNNNTPLEFDDFSEGSIDVAVSIGKGKSAETSNIFFKRLY